MPMIRDREWRDENDDSNYPFEDRATLINDVGQTVLSGTFLDAALYPAGSSTALHLSKVTLANNVVTIYIGDTNSDSVCFGSFDLQDPPNALRLEDAYGRSAGILVSETLKLATFQAWPLGTHVFNADQTPFVAAVSFPTPENRVEGLLTDDAELVSGELWLVGGEGIVLSCRDAVEADGTAVHVIRADAVGEPLFRRKLCSGGSFETPHFLRQITVQKGDRSHVVTPNNFGDIQITVGSQLSASTILRISPVPSGLRFEAVGELT